MKERMFDFVKDHPVLVFNTQNAGVLAIVSFTQVKDILGIILLVLSIISTLIIIRNNAKKKP